jgi:hypothetical protein
MMAKIQPNPVIMLMNQDLAPNQKQILIDLRKEFEILSQ